jgi:probable F420-dependent oxidoreductase
MKLLTGIFLTHANELVGHNGEHLLEAARILDEERIDYVVIADHVLLSSGRQGHDALGSPLPFQNDEPYPDPLVTLAAVGAVTSRIRLATGVLIAPLRPAPVLAKMAATVASLFGGRLDLGVGSGWQHEEFAACGVPIAAKAQRLDDCVSACKTLWRDSPASFHSETVSFDNVVCSPRPPGGDIPVWFGGRAVPGTLSRIARLGAGWLPLRLPSASEVRRARCDLVRQCYQVGRDPAAIGIRVALPTVRDQSGIADLAETLHPAAELIDAGVTGVQVRVCDFARSPSELRDVAATLRGLCEELGET